MKFLRSMNLIEIVVKLNQRSSAEFNSHFNKSVEEKRGVYYIGMRVKKLLENFNAGEKVLVRALMVQRIVGNEIHPF